MKDGLKTSLVRYLIIQIPCMYYTGYQINQHQLKMITIEKYHSWVSLERKEEVKNVKYKMLLKRAALQGQNTKIPHTQVECKLKSFLSNKPGKRFLYHYVL